VVQQPYQQQFALYDVREDAAEKVKCVNRLDPTLIAKGGGIQGVRQYFGAVFRLGVTTLSKRPWLPYGRAKAIPGS
jgi:hypothetical protein